VGDRIDRSNGAIISGAIERPVIGYKHSVRPDRLDHLSADYSAAPTAFDFDEILVAYIEAFGEQRMYLTVRLWCLLHQTPNTARLSAG
jgi:hypothetical protein